MTKANPSIQIAPEPVVPIVTMITPGRRALGEDWSRVTIGHQKGDEMVLVREDCEAPADRKPIIVPAMGNLAPDAAAFILDEGFNRAEERKKNPQGVSAAELEKIMQAMFVDYMEMKLRELQGISTFSAGHMAQRQSVQRKRAQPHGN